MSLSPANTDRSLVNRESGVHREKQDTADMVENVRVMHGNLHKSS